MYKNYYNDNRIKIYLKYLNSTYLTTIFIILRTYQRIVLQIKNNMFNKQLN